MRRIRFLELIVIMFVFCELFSSCSIIKKKQEAKIAYLENMISVLEEETIPIKFRILNNKDKIISVELIFLDLNGKTVKKEKLDIAGSELHFDFQVIQLEHQDKNNNLENNQFMFYPFKLYTETIAPENGIDLCELYNIEGFPGIYRGFEQSIPNVDEKMKKAYYEKINQTFTYIINNQLENLSNQYGNAIHDMQGISEFKKGYIYSIICHPHTGAIEVERE